MAKAIINLVDKVSDSLNQPEASITDPLFTDPHGFLHFLQETIRIRNRYLISVHAENWRALERLAEDLRWQDLPPARKVTFL